MSGQEFRIKVVSPVSHYSESFKRMVVREYEQGGVSKDALMYKYGIAGHSLVLNWCRKYGKLDYPKGTSIGRPMKDPQKRRIKELEQALERERLKVEAYQKLIEIAEREEGISILKKDAAKQLQNWRKSTRDA